MANVNKVWDQIFGNIGQERRLLKLDTPLGPDALLPQRIHAFERMSEGFDYTVDLLALDPDIKLKELIAQEVTLWILQPDTSYLPVHGFVHTAKKLGSDGQLTAYQIGFSSCLHFLKFRKDARIWQDKSADEIIADVLAGHSQCQGRFRFELSQPGRPRSYCTQYETDWHFVMRMMESEGWYAYIEQASDGSGHEWIVTDSVVSLKPLVPEEIAFHGAASTDEINRIVQWGSARQLLNSQLLTRTFDYKAPRSNTETSTQVLPEHGSIPSQLEVYEYTGAYTGYDTEHRADQSRLRVQEWESRAKRFFGTSGVRNLSVGKWFTLTDHPAHDEAGVEARQFIVLNIEWSIENNLPLSIARKEFSGTLKGQLAKFKLEAGLADSEAADENAANSRTGHCFNRFEVQRRTVEYRSPFSHAKPAMSTQTATVVGPTEEEIYTDHLNRVKVRFHWDRLNPGDEKASCWVRVSYPNAGDGWGAVHVPRIGQEVLITYLDGDADRPVITGRIYNGEQMPDWHSDGRLSGYKSKEYKGAGYNQLVMDDTSEQSRLQLFSSNTNAQLSLGYLVGQQGNNRAGFYGSGFALNTDAYGAISAQQGLYIGTYGRPGPQGTQLDVREARDQLKEAKELTKNLSDVAEKSGAEALPGQDSLQEFIDATQATYDGPGQEQANRFGAPVLLASSPAGIGVSTPKSTHLHSGEQVTMSSGADTNLAAGKSLIASIKEKISLFAYNAGIRLFAAKGKVEIQAQSGDIDIIAEKVLRLLSTEDRIEIFAKKEIVIGAGGSAITINGSGITDMTGGRRISHNSEFSVPGPKTMAYPLPTLPKEVCLECLKKRAKQRGAFVNKGAQ
ncbi:type VI secretion system Vgr family protein [Pseudoduganella plicata]|uniref:Type IV secretion protein Rhs n=1 Tax=Pseudoduganella plicata TaxID=321984 RepID=A0A4P7BAP3_9BURK|nr:type VI secretion system tip protein TssI/VgrG [Pseudoduganella plicata]QBQ35646.1 type VI secretion system tip protein VgrG [Pseudoduganella plicata]GGY96333.1 type IV secretion protein Rhs [Pseudoduganella plicata]